MVKIGGWTIISGLFLYNIHTHTLSLMVNGGRFSAWTVPGLLDRIYTNLKANDVKFHSWKNLAAHESKYNKEQMEAIGYDGLPCLSVP